MLTSTPAARYFTGFGMAALLVIGSVAVAPFLFAQPRPAADYQITHIAKNLIATPLSGASGVATSPSNHPNTWLQVEVQFAAVPDVTDDLTFKYYILLNGRVLTGEVTHTNILGGRDNYSVMYVSPRTLTRFLGNRPLTANSIPNIAVQIVNQGAISDEASLVRARPQWFAALPQVAGFVLNKSETPFAALDWDHYEQIKTH